MILLSAGIGVTPVLAMLHALAAARSTRDIWWLHTARSAAEHTFADEAHHLLTTLIHGHEHVHYTRESSTTSRAPAVTLGRLNHETLASLDLPTTATVYLCGPDAFMTAMRAALTQLGLDPARIHTELFASRPAINPGLTAITRTPPHPPPGPTGTGPNITFTRSGLTAPWSDDYPTILEFAEACDIPTQWSCRTGVCHTCQTPILSGTVQYGPQPLEPPARGTVLVCCSQPETDLTLDL